MGPAPKLEIVTQTWKCGLRPSSTIAISREVRSPPQSALLTLTKLDVNGRGVSDDRLAGIRQLLAKGSTIDRIVIACNRRSESLTISIYEPPAGRTKATGTFDFPQHQN